MDKRYGHLSDLIKVGQTTRAQALEEMKKSPYPEELQQQDIEYACKKFSLTREQFDDIMRAPVRTFRDYRNSYAVFEFMRDAINWLRARGFYPR